ncbi:hypothetical protein A374_00220 [Fictibacillus macauensis ZFHKF-1]|uniref:DinB-like domain-containing protein n=1 Tax=Fictibacillus macauensis ZFHKF-1 TaxID=1196324 RepID=I8UKS0_9BACL|nr:DinB family protein [Fictibacillus macauensis]EIT87450.1 hypothetical protein A374_00220 [Fictibacillus macauensis ZFHKF-1]
MNFSLSSSLDLLQRTPATLTALLQGLSADWLHSTEGEGTWNSVEVLDHLIVCEQTNWLPRLEFLLAEGEQKLFPPFDREAHLGVQTTETLDEKLQKFTALRTQSLQTLQVLATPDALEQTGQHPAFGTVKARELIATWTVHDLTHIAQIVRVFATHYKSDVGPWIAYLGILQK